MYRPLPLLAFLVAIPLFAAKPAVVAASPATAKDYGSIPLSFEANHGQVDAKVRYLSRGRSYSLFLTNTSAVLSLGQPNACNGQTPEKSTRQFSTNTACTSAAPGKQDIVRMSLVGSSLREKEPRVTGELELPEKVNYFLGNDPAKWQSGLPTFAKVRYSAVYPGVDLVYYGNQRQLEYDFIAAPGADIASIQISFKGEKNIHLSSEGDLILQGAYGSAAFHRPVAYQEIDGKRRSVAAAFSIAANKTVAFRIGSYDHTHPLVIDPILVYSTYIGGSGYLSDSQRAGGSNGIGDLSNGIAIDAEGSAYIVGTTASTDYPVTTGAYQSTNNVSQASYDSTVFVTKLNASGTGLVYSTYLGGSAFEAGLAIAVDANQNAYITGDTASSDFPVTSGAFQSTNRSAANHATSAFVAKLNGSGTALLYSTYLGGTNPAWPQWPGTVPGDAGNAIAVDSEGNAVIGGSTLASDFPTTVGAFQTNYRLKQRELSAFVTKLNPSGTALVFSTYLSGTHSDFGANFSRGDEVNAITLDSSENVYAAGRACSKDFPVTSAAFQKVNPGSQSCSGFITKLDGTGSTEIYSSYLGGTRPYSGDPVNAIVVDNVGNAYVGGQDYSATTSGFPLTAGVIQTQSAGAYGIGFVSKIAPDGSSLVYSTFLGGRYGSSVTGLAVDAAGNAFATGPITYGDFPTSENAIAATALNTVQEGLLAELNPSATGIVYATLLGDSSDSRGIALDPGGNVFVTGAAYPDPNRNSYDTFPTTDGAFQSTNKGDGNKAPNAFVQKLALAGETTSHSFSSLTFSQSATSVKQGEAEILTAAVTGVPGGATPTGKVQFYGYYYPTGATYAEDLPLITILLNGSGVAQWSNSTNPTGRYVVRAKSTGDGAYLGSTWSNTLDYIVTEGSSSLAIDQFQLNGANVYGQATYSLIVTAKDAVGDILRGVTVNFAGSGFAFSPSSVVTDVSGFARTTATPTSPGNLTATASVEGSAQTLNFPSVTIAPAPLTVTLHKNFRYYGDPTFPHIPVNVAGLVGSETVTVDVHDPTNISTPVGSYPLTATVGGPYISHYEVTVVPANLEVHKVYFLNVIAQDEIITYGQTPSQPTRFFFSGFRNGDTASVVSGAPILLTNVTATTPPGYYPIRIQLGTLSSTNYEFAPFAQPGVIAVRKALLSAKANDIVIHRYDPIPPFTYTLTGFVNGDTPASSVTGTALMRTDARSQTRPGVYPIYMNIGTLYSPNYSLTPVNGTLTILP